MIKDFTSFSATEVGYNHVKAGKVCEDFSSYYDDDRMRICVVADGHGSDNYPRTDKGSRFAAEAAINCVKEFVKTAIPTDVLEDEKNGFPVLRQLASSILLEWHRAVNEDAARYPFTDEELKNVSEKYKNRFLTQNVEERSIEKAYGTTLIVFVITEQYSMGMQIGDGKCVFISSRGEFSEPIPWDDECQLNVTTSICDSDALDEFRFFVTDKQPSAVFCGSDGIDDSYASEEELYALYRSILVIFAEHGLEVGKSEIKEYLPALTRKGSGDDVSIGLILDIEIVKGLIPLFNAQAELFDVNGKTNEKKRRLVAVKENVAKMGKRFTKGIGNAGDVARLQDLVNTQNIIENELSELMEKKEQLVQNLEALVQGINMHELSMGTASDLPTDDNTEIGELGTEINVDRLDDEKQAEEGSCELQKVSKEANDADLRKALGEESKSVSVIAYEETMSDIIMAIEENKD